MPAVLPIVSAAVNLPTVDQAGLEGLGGMSAKSSTSFLSEVPGHIDECQSITEDSEKTPDAAAQIVASVWSKRQLIVAYILLWFICAVTSLFSNILSALSPYVTSAFQMHSYAAATGIVANVLGALCTIPTSKLLQRWGRAQGLATMLIIWMIGLIMLAACRDVWTFAAAQVFTSVGSTGGSYCVSVFVADTTSLRNRGLMFSFSTSPDIITMWIGGPVAASLLRGIGWRWGFGIFVFALPAVVLPFWGLIFWNQRKAHKIGKLSNSEGKSSKETAFSVVKKFAIEVDLVGLLMLASGISLFLLPFTLYSFQKAQFGSPLIISLLVVGLVLILGFTLYERFLAPTTIIPFSVLVDRTTLCALATATLAIIGFTLIAGYMTSVLQVVYGFNVTQTSYLVSSIQVAICFWTLLIGLFARWTGRLKLLQLVFGVPFMMVAAGVWLHFRQPNQGGLVVMVFVILLISFGLGTTTLTCTLVMMAALGQDNITVVLALTIFIANVAPAIGEAINTGIWTGVFKKALEERLHLHSDVEINQIYSSLDVQLSFPKGSLVRNGIAEAYMDAKFYMLVTSLCILSLAMLTTLFWRDLRAKESETTGKSASELQ